MKIRRSSSIRSRNNSILFFKTRIVESKRIGSSFRSVVIDRTFGHRKSFSSSRNYVVYPLPKSCFEKCFRNTLYFLIDFKKVLHFSCICFDPFSNCLSSVTGSIFKIYKMLFLDRLTTQCCFQYYLKSSFIISLRIYSYQI